MSLRAYVGLGSNRGDSRRTLDAACAELGGLPGLRARRRSTTRSYAAVGGPPGQDPYWNGVLELDCELAPHELLARLQAVEAAHGRDRRREERWGPRTLDLDLLILGELRLAGPELELPHPRLLERVFVLEPLAELVPELVVPGADVRVRAALDRLRVAAGAERP